MSVETTPIEHDQGDVPSLAQPAVQNKPTHPVLAEMCNVTDEDLKLLRKRDRQYSPASLTMGIVTILLSVALAQRDQLEKFFIPEVFVVVGYVLAVLVALDKFFGLEKTRQAIRQATATLLLERTAVYSAERVEMAKRGNLPVDNEFAAALAERIGLARQAAIRVLHEVR